MRRPRAAAHGGRRGRADHDDELGWARCSALHSPLDSRSAGYRLTPMAPPWLDARADAYASAGAVPPEPIMCTATSSRPVRTRSAARLPAAYHAAPAAVRVR